MPVIDSGSRLWDAMGDKPLDQLRVSPQTRDLLRRSAFVTPMPEVRRVIFIATPQHGSFVAGSTIGQLLWRLVTLPLGVVTVLGEAVGGNPDAVRASPGSAGFGSVWSMTPDNPALQALAAIPISPNVATHSIIGSGVTARSRLATTASSPISAPTLTVSHPSRSCAQAIRSNQIRTPWPKCAAFCCSIWRRPAPRAVSRPRPVARQPSAARSARCRPPAKTRGTTRGA
jgi:hypothetical protein